MGNFFHQRQPSRWRRPGCSTTRRPAARLAPGHSSADRGAVSRGHDAALARPGRAGPVPVEQAPPSDAVDTPVRGSRDVWKPLCARSWSTGRFGSMLAPHRPRRGHRRRGRGWRGLGEDSTRRSTRWSAGSLTERPSRDGQGGARRRRSTSADGAAERAVFSGAPVHRMGARVGVRPASPSCWSIPTTAQVGHETPAPGRW